MPGPICRLRKDVQHLVDENGIPICARRPKDGNPCQRPVSIRGIPCSDHEDISH